MKKKINITILFTLKLSLTENDISEHFIDQEPKRVNIMKVKRYKSSNT